MTIVTAIGTLTSESADSDYVTDKGDCPKHYYQCILVMGSSDHFTDSDL